jgi:hypothetical protein
MEFPKVRRPARRRSRGVTLIEAVLYIAIALALIVGGLVFYQQTLTASRMNSTVRLMTALVAEMRIVARETNFYTNAFGVDAILVARGAVPAANIDMAQSITRRIRNDWGGQIEFNVNERGGKFFLEAQLFNVPVSACARLTMSDGAGRNLIASGLVQAKARPDQGGMDQNIPKG